MPTPAYTIKYVIPNLHNISTLISPLLPSKRSLTMQFLPLRSLLFEPLNFLLSFTPLSRFLPKKDHFAPHPNAPFEGYYTRILTTTGSTILLIFSSVFSAIDRPHYVHFSLLPRNGSSQHRIVVDKFPKITDANGHKFPNSIHEFSRVAKGDGVEGTYRICRDEQRYRLELDTVEHGKLEVSIDLTDRKAWIPDDDVSTPEGVFSKLIFLLPLHWNVFSTASSASYSITANGQPLESGTGIAHIEKNWGISFPRGWTWIQGFSGSPVTGEARHKARSFVMAGGKILGQKAFLLGYRSENIEWSFGPPFTLMPFCFQTPLMKEAFDSKRGVARYEVGALWKKLVVEVQAPSDHEGWLGLHCPLADGHVNTYAYESFDGSVRVKAYERACSLEWELVEETILDGAAVEFGGDYSFKVSK